MTSSRIKGSGTNGPETSGLETSEPKTTDPEVESPEVESPEMESPEMESPEVESPEMKRDAVHPSSVSLTGSLASLQTFASLAPCFIFGCLIGNLYCFYRKFCSAPT